MTEDKAYETQRVMVEFEPEVRLVDGNTYAAEARTLPEGYREHLEDALMGRCQAMTESEYEDTVRYSAEPQVEVQAPVTASAPLAQATETTEVVRVFNRRYLPAVIAFGVTVLAVVLTLLFTVPGTAWEKESIIIKSGAPVVYGTQVAAAQTQSVNTIYVDGESKEVTLEPYAESKAEHSNWFDKLCDWLNGVVGG